MYQYLLTLPQKLMTMLFRYWYVVLVLLILGFGIPQIIYYLPTIIKYGKFFGLI